MPVEIQSLIKEIDRFKENVANSDKLLNSLKSVDTLLTEHNATHQIILSEISELKNTTASNKTDIENMVVTIQAEQFSKFNYFHKSIIFLIILGLVNFIAIFVLFFRILV